MKLLWKVLAGALAILVVALIGVAVAVALIFEPNDYRPMLIEVVEENTGRNFELPGDLDLSWFPCCSVAVGPSSLSNPPGFPDQSFAKIESAALSLKLWPLITRREIEIGTVTLDGLDISLIQLADGRGNWEFETPQAEASATDEPSNLGALNVAGVEIRNGQVRYQDQGTESAFTASNLRIDTGAVGENLPIPVDMTLDLTDESNGTSAQLTLATTVGLAGDLVTFAALNLELEAPGARLRMQGDGTLGTPDAVLQGKVEILDGAPRELLAAFGEPYAPADSSALQSLSGTGSWRADYQSAALSDLELMLDDTLLTGGLGIDNLETLALRFDLQLNGMDLDRYVAEPADQKASSTATPAANADADATTLPLDALKDVPLQGQLQIAQLRAAGVDVTNVDFAVENTANRLSLSLNGDTAGGSFSITGSGNIAATNPQLSGTVELSSLSPRQLLTALGDPPQTADPAALSDLSGKSQWRLTRRSIALDPLNLQLDRTSATGSLKIDDFDQLAARVALSLDRLDLDAYLPPEDAAAEEAETDAEIPVDEIRELNLTGTLQVRELTALKLRLQNLQADVRAADGVLRLAPLKASLYGGTYQGSLTIDATGPKAVLSMDQQISTVQIGEVLQSFFATDRVSGALSLQLDGSGKGNNFNELLEVLNGNFALQLVDGLYRGMDIQHEIRSARSLLKKEPPPTEPDTKETPIRSLSLSGKLAEGILGSDDLTADLPSLRLTGKGGLNLIKQTLDYRLNALVLRDTTDADAASLKDLVDLKIPLTIEGPMMAPKVGVDMKGLLTEAVRGKVEKRARDLLLKKLGEPEEPASSTGAETEAAVDDDAQSPAEATEKESTKDLFKRGLRDLLKQQQPAEEGT